MSRLPDTGRGSRGRRMRLYLRRSLGKGVTSNLVWLAGLLIFCGLAIDMASDQRMKSSMRSAAELAALAAVRALPDQAAAVQGAKQSLGALAFGPYARVEIGERDLVFGRWDESGGFRADAASTNAARVKLRSEARVQTLFTSNLLDLVGLGARDIEVSATAVRQAGEPCGASEVEACIPDAHSAQAEAFVL